MKHIYLTVRENGDNWVVTAMRARHFEGMVFSQMPDKNLEGEKGYFKLDFEYFPKGKYVGEMKMQGSVSLHIYETSLQELKELAEIEEEATERMVEAKKVVEKEREEYFKKLNTHLEQEDMMGGEGGEYV